MHILKDMLHADYWLYFLVKKFDKKGPDFLIARYISGFNCITDNFYVVGLKKCVLSAFSKIVHVVS